MNRLILSVLTVSVTIAVVTSSDCDPKTCENSTCTDVSEDFCSLNNGLLVKKDISKCRCCVSCVVIRDEGQSCEKTDNLTINCGRGQKCNEETKVCESNRDSGKSKPKDEPKKETKEVTNAEVPETSPELDQPLAVEDTPLSDPVDSSLEDDPGVLPEKSLDPDSKDPIGDDDTKMSEMEELSPADETSKDNIDVEEPKKSEESIESEIESKQKQLDSSNEQKQALEDERVAEERKLVDSITDIDDESTETTEEEERLREEIKQKKLKLQQMRRSLEEIQSEIEAEQEQIKVLTEEKKEIKEEKKKLSDEPKVEDPPGPQDEELPDDAPAEDPLFDIPPDEVQGTQTDPEMIPPEESHDLKANQEVAPADEVKDLKTDDEIVPVEEDRDLNADPEVAPADEVKDLNADLEMISPEEGRDLKANTEMVPLGIVEPQYPVGRIESNDEMPPPEILEILESAEPRNGPPSVTPDSDVTPPMEKVENDKIVKVSIKEQIQDASSSEKATENVKEQADGTNVDISMVDLGSIESELRRDEDLSENEKEELSEVIEDLESVDMTKEEEISEEIGKKRRKLQRLRSNIEKEKEKENDDGGESKDVKEMENDVELKQKEIHELSEKREEIRESGEGGQLKDEKSELAISEEIGEIRQELEILRSDLKEEKNEGNQEKVDEIETEIEVKVKEIHELTLERDEIKMERKEREEDMKSETGSEVITEKKGDEMSMKDDEISDQETKEAAEMAADMGADMIIMDSEGEARTFDVSKEETGDTKDEQVVLEEKSSSDVDPEKPTVWVAKDEESGLVPSGEEGKKDEISDEKMYEAAEEAFEKGADVVVDSKEEEPKAYDVSEDDGENDKYVFVEKDIKEVSEESPTVLVSEDEDTRLIPEGRTSSELEKVKQAAEEKQEEVVVIESEKGVQSAGLKVYPSWDLYLQEQSEEFAGFERHTDFDHKLKELPSTKSGTNKVIAITKPNEKINIIEERDGSKVIVLETPLGSDEALLPDPMTEPTPDKVEELIEAKLQEAGPPSPNENVGVPLPEEMIIKQEPQNTMEKLENAGEKTTGLFTPQYTAVQSPYQGPHGRRWWRSRPPSYRMSGYENEYGYDYDFGGDYYDASFRRRSRRRQRGHRRRESGRQQGRRRRGSRRTNQGMTYRDMIRVNKRNYNEIQPTAAKFDPRMEWAFDAEDQLGQWAADPVFKKEKVTAESLGPWAAEPVMQLTRNLDKKTKTSRQVEPWMVDEDVVDTSGKAEVDDYFFDSENKRGPVLKGQNRKDHVALDKEMERVWKSWAELMTIKHLLHAKKKRDPKVDTLIKDEGDRFEKLLKVHAAIYGNPHPILVP